MRSTLSAAPARAPSRAFLRPLLLIPAALLALGLSGCVSTGPSKPATQRGAFGVPLDDIEAAGLENVKGEQKVVIGAFRVAFNQSVKASAQSSALFSSNSVSAHMDGTLHGLDDSVYQAITDAAYADFVTKLKAGGFAVVEPRDLGQSPLYAKLAGVDNPQALDSSTTGKVIMVAPTGTKLTLFPGDNGVASGFSGFDGGSPIRVFPALIKEQQAGVISVTYYIDFLNAESSGKSLVAGGDAEVSMGQGLSVRAGSGIAYSTVKGSQCVGYCPNITSTVKLGQAVYSSQAYGSTRDTTSGAANALGAVSGILSGRGFSTKSIEIDADPARYQLITGQLLADTNTALLATLGQAR